MSRFQQFKFWKRGNGATNDANDDLILNAGSISAQSADEDTSSNKTHAKRSSEPAKLLQSETSPALGTEESILDVMDSSRTRRQSAAEVAHLKGKSSKKSKRNRSRNDLSKPRSQTVPNNQTKARAKSQANTKNAAPKKGSKKSNKKRKKPNKSEKMMKMINMYEKNANNSNGNGNYQSKTPNSPKNRDIGPNSQQTGNNTNIQHLNSVGMNGNTKIINSNATTDANNGNNNQLQGSSKLNAVSLSRDSDAKQPKSDIESSMANIDPSMSIRYAFSSSMESSKVEYKHNYELDAEYSSVSNYNAINAAASAKTIYYTTSGGTGLKQPSADATNKRTFYNSTNANIINNVISSNNNVNTSNNININININMDSNINNNNSKIDSIGSASPSIVYNQSNTETKENSVVMTQAAGITWDAPFVQEPPPKAPPIKQVWLLFFEFGCNIVYVLL